MRKSGMRNQKSDTQNSQSWTEIAPFYEILPRQAEESEAQFTFEGILEIRKSMLHSTVTNKGQTTIPGKIRKALGMKPGDRLVYVMQGNHVIIRVHPGTRSLKGVLASKKGKGMSFAQIREVLAGPDCRSQNNR